MSTTGAVTLLGPGFDLQAAGGLASVGIDNLTVEIEALADEAGADGAGPLHAALSAYAASPTAEGEASLGTSLRTSLTAIPEDAMTRARARLDGGQIHVSQTGIDALVRIKNPPVHEFVKDAPVLGYLIPERLEDIPLAIRDHLGITDDVEYSTKWIEGNVGSIITLQMNGTTPDFYPQRLGNYQSKYRGVTRTDVEAKNAKMFGRLRNVPGLAEIIDNDPNVVFILRTTPQKMYRVSDVISAPEGSSIIVKVPQWGPDSTQTAQPGAYLVYEVLETNPDWTPKTWHHYVVNADEKTDLPIGYIAKP